MKLIAASELEGRLVVCKFLEREGDTRPEWLLEREGRCSTPAGRRVWVRFPNPYHKARFDSYIMDWRELEPMEERT